MDATKVREVIELEYSRIHHVNDIAKLLNTSSETLRKDFVRTTHITISQWLRQTRVEKAKALLRSTDDQCKEICFKVGFTREEVGARVFRRETGLTMNQYRQLARSDAGGLPCGGERPRLAGRDPRNPVEETVPPRTSVPEAEPKGISPQG